MPDKSVTTTCRFISSLIPLLLCFNFGNAQNNFPVIDLTLSFKELPLEEALTAISNKSGISFSYNPKKIPIRQAITYEAENQPLEDIVRFISEETSLAYEFVEGQIILKPARRNAKDVARKVTLSGYITDSSNGEALIGATVVITDLAIGASSNVFGFYSLTVPEGEYDLTYSFIGFKRSDLSVHLMESASMNVTLSPEPSVLQEILVTSPNFTLVDQVQLSKTNLRPSTVSERPSFFGEADAVKSLESMPGIKMHSDGSTFYYVRGGERDQNLILLDDAPIFNPSHLLGIFSTIIPDAVNDISMYKGSMPASLGGRLSSVMDVRTKRGNDQYFQASGGVGLLSTKLSLEGPIKKDKSSYLLSGRLSRIKWFFQLANEEIQKFNFYDLTGKVNFVLNERNKLFFSFYTGSDNFFTSSNGIEWMNRTTSVKWNHLFNRRLFLNTTLAGGVYDYFVHTNIQNQAKWNSHISNVNLKLDFSYFKNPKEDVTFGVTFGGYNFNPGNFSRGGVVQPPAISVKNSSEFVIYGNHEIRFNDHWGLAYGLRLSSWSAEGGSFEFLFDQNKNPVDTLFFRKGVKYKTYENLEPRVSVSHFIDDKSSIKASFSRNVQNIHLITNSISPFTSFEVWLPSSFNIRPQTANQFALGYY
ncbi:MAG: TonB-dependent receptor, partial [Cyclobacteriaceae bacterium]